MYHTLPPCGLRIELPSDEFIHVHLKPIPPNSLSLFTDENQLNERFDIIDFFPIAMPLVIEYLCPIFRKIVSYLEFSTTLEMLDTFKWNVALSSLSPSTDNVSR